MSLHDLIELLMASGMSQDQAFTTAFYSIHNRRGSVERRDVGSRWQSAHGQTRRDPRAKTLGNAVARRLH